jgi:hypothetical protein
MLVLRITARLPVQEGQALGLYHYIDRTKPPVPAHSPRTGVLLTLNHERLPGKTKQSL